MHRRLAIPGTDHKAHGLAGELELPDWPPLTLAEVNQVLMGYPAAHGAKRIVSFSPRPFSAASVVETSSATVLIKRHARLVRDRAGLIEEHALINFLARQMPQTVKPVLCDEHGETAIEQGEWTYEVHPLAQGLDIYSAAPSWTPFLNPFHARAAGDALAKLHLALETYIAPPRRARQLVSSFTIFSASDPERRMEAYLKPRHLLSQYASERHWRTSIRQLFLPYFQSLSPWLSCLKPLWTHNDFHASNLLWTGAHSNAQVAAIIDFGLADRTNRVYDLATAIERNAIEWLRMGDGEGVRLVHLDHLDALLEGYDEVWPLTYAESKALAALLPLVHCEFALSETDYFLSVLDSKRKAYLAYEGYLIGHAEWFRRREGEGLLEHLEQWANRKLSVVGRKL